MKRNEAIDNAFKAGFELVNGSIHVDGEDVTDEIVLLVNIIEQATLGRAEKVCEDYANFAAITMDALSAANYIASKIYELKDSHE